MMGQSALETWVETQLKPWQQEVAAHMQAKAEALARVKAHGPQLEAMLGLLMEGRTRAALLAWNALGIPPLLEDIRVSDDGARITLVARGGQVTVLDVDALDKELAAGR